MPRNMTPSIAMCDCPIDIDNRHYLSCMLRRDRERAEKAERELAELRKAALEAWQHFITCADKVADPVLTKRMDALVEALAHVSPPLCSTETKEKHGT